ncbi:MAG: hypothetical protein CVU42_11915 [Chloroflexi bacterium HGW-Chloroflexi-4]|jgi:phenylacetate-coenzyme A ligase PaaK-like adenylate-forming protein|nr:MAG: hypothetical protein CVU42_11915 [Chloroflexi bacterium HGW-Chloroflexi-4]
MSLLKNFFDENPSITRIASQIISTIPMSIRLGKNFWEWYSFFNESEGWDIKKLQDYQLICLRSLLCEVYNSSIYFRQIISITQINKIYTLEDFKKNVPTLSRADFRDNYNYILSNTPKYQKLEKSQTSGTTGMAIQFYHDASDRDREWAAICHQWKRVGYDPANSRRAEFRGLNHKDQIVNYMPHQNALRCSILHMQKEHIIKYADEIEKNKIDFYHGYPSAFYLLANEILRYGIKFPQPKAVLLASENVFDWQVDKIQEAFPNSKIFAHYGCAERTVLAGWCEYRHEYHVMPQYGLFELNEETGEIIGTNLVNTTNAFIRYKMSDAILKFENTICPDCNRPYTPRLIEIGGRTEDYLYSIEKGWIPPAIVTYPLKSLKVINEIQFVQNEKSEIIIRYTKPASKNELIQKDLDEIIDGINQLFGTNTRCKFEIVDGFERGVTGKFKWIINNLAEKP